VVKVILVLDFMVTKCVDGAFRGEVDQDLRDQLNALRLATIAVGVGFRTPLLIDNDAGA
jgi:hypothetical protein